MGMAGTGAARLTAAERAVLVVPLLGGAVFGLAPFFVQPLFASMTGASGDDPYVYRLAGAATFGYAVALAMGIAAGGWTALRAVVVATLVFNVVSILACLVEILLGRAQPVVYLILATSIFISATTTWLISRRRESWTAPRDVVTAVVIVIAFATVAAAIFGTLPQLVGVIAAPFGYRGTDEFVYRQAGAATLGYAAMGIVEIRAPQWDRMALPTVMALTFNGMSVVASVVSIVAGDATPVTYLIGVAATAFTATFIVVLARRGR